MVIKNLIGKHTYHVVLITMHLLNTVLVAYAATSSGEAFSRMQRLQEQNKVPAYVLEKGTYKYAQGIRIAHVQGKNVFMRSQPLKNARIIAKLTHVDLEYLGEWIHPNNGERWICVRRNGEIGWIYGQYIKLLEERAVTNNKTTHSSKKSTSSDLGILLFFGFLILSAFLRGLNEGNGTSQSSEGSSASELSFDLAETKRDCCPHYQRNLCEGCGELNGGDRPFSSVLYAKCAYFGKYVRTSKSPQYNADHLESFEDECCPYYNKYSCGDCPKMDSTKSSAYNEGYYKCRYFNAYVQQDESPQYNSVNLKYR